jgi:hypothetical protein
VAHAAASGYQRIFQSSVDGTVAPRQPAGTSPPR